LTLRVEVSNLSSIKRQLQVEISADVVAQEFDRISAELARQVHVPGFRPGRAPKSVIKARFRDEIRNEVIKNLVPSALQNAVDQERLEVVGEPSVTEISVNDGKPLLFKTVVEIMPTVPDPEYKGIEVTRKVKRITDEDVEREVRRLQETLAQLVPVEDRPAQDGDYAMVNVVGRYINANEQELKVDNMTVVINGPDTPPEFTENIRGSRIGQQRTFRVKRRQEHSSRDLAGREMECTITLEGLYTKELPELDDDFARGLGQYEGLEDLRSKLRQQLEREAQQQADEDMRAELLRLLVERNNFDVPDYFVKQQLESYMQSVAETLMMQGIDPRNAGIDWEALLNERRPQALREVQGALLLERIAELEAIEISEEELDAEVARIAQFRGKPIGATKSRLTKEGSIDSIRNRLRNQKALDIVVDNAKVTTREVDADADRLAQEAEGD